MVKLSGLRARFPAGGIPIIAKQGRKNTIEEKLLSHAMSIRKQTLCDPKKEQYSGFVNYGPVPPEDPEMLMQVISFHIDWHANPVEVSDWLFST
jgi:hypothetical protein